MPLSAESPAYLHYLQNISLVLIAAAFTPLFSVITLICLAISTLKSLVRHGKVQPSFRRRRILVTGVGMSKGLFIARAFHREEHIVIGADFEPRGIPVCGRFSKALMRFYSLTKPIPPDGSFKYAQNLVDIIQKENVDLWISCSGVMSAVEDGEAAELVEKKTKCKAIQFEADITKMLHEKHSFIENTKSLGLNTPDTYLVNSVEDATDILYPGGHGRVAKDGEVLDKYILKSVGVDDSVRADMTLLPLSSLSKTKQHISRSCPSASRPFVLQQFIRGPEYCTHSIIIRGKVAAFTSCASQELLMHYKPLPAEDPIFKAMLKYTEDYLERMEIEMTGHFSIDFLLNQTDPTQDIADRIFPIECNPRAHTAVVNFCQDTKSMVEAYLQVLNDTNPNDTTAFPTSFTCHYWVGHDIVTRLVLPVLGFLTWRSGLGEVLRCWVEFAQHILRWSDPTFAVWDPVPAWWLYCVYWPGMFIASITYREWWSRCNVSTGKMFRC